MKRALVILWICLFAVVDARAGMFDFTNEVHWISLYGSFDTAPYPMQFAYQGSFINNMNNKFTNSHLPASRSGSSIFGDYTDLVPARLMPFMTWGKLPIWLIECANENGGPSSNSIVSWITNFFRQPPEFWNTNFNNFTNESGLTFNTVIPVLDNGANDNAYNDPTANFIISRAALAIAAEKGYVSVNTYDAIQTNGILTDALHLLGYYAGQHWYPAGQLALALWRMYLMGAPTNIYSVTMDFNGAAITQTNFFAANTPTLSGGTFIFTFTLGRNAGGWDVPDGALRTNDCRDCFKVYPMLGDMFHCVWKATNLPAGNYTATVDGQFFFTASSQNLSNGYNAFTNYNGPLWWQRVVTLDDERNWYGVNTNTLEEIGPTGPYGGNLLNYQSNSKIYLTNSAMTGTNFVMTMSNAFGWPSNMNVYRGVAFNHAQQVQHTFALAPVGTISSLFTTNASMGTVHWGAP